jgi:7,8-dihydro-6-hydroxymethylpterin-pyrophosphokinase
MHFGVALGSNLGDRAENIRCVCMKLLLARVPGVKLNCQRTGV